MTDRQDAIYKFIRDYIQEHGYPPMIREIGKAVGLKSVSNVCYHLRNLEEKDLIKRVHGSSRAIKLVGYRVELVPEKMPIQRFDLFDATFKPKRTDDLKPEVDDWVGYRGIFEALWVIDDEDGGSYVDMWAMGVHGATKLDPMPPFAWVPECDLEFHSLITKLVPEE